VKSVAGCLVALAVLIGSGSALAQDAAPPEPERPRLEVGAGVSVFFSGGTMPYTDWMLDTRVGVKVSRNWSLEGLVHFVPGSWADVAGFYRAQALWRIGRGSVQPFVAFGGAGEFSRYSWPEYEWTDYYTGEARVARAGSNFSISAPWYPTASAGVEKVLASHLALRAELTAAFGVNDYGIAVAFVPSVSASVPIGRYRTAAR
jgi:hypothetical protein